jgi:hypothetical protein
MTELGFPKGCLGSASMASGSITQGPWGAFLYVEYLGGGSMLEGAHSCLAVNISMNETQT